MAVKTEDKRVRRTKKAIREALLRIMAVKSVAQVTTTELCREADVNRNTFYTHYSAPEDVLAAVDEELLAELTELIESGYHEGRVTLEMCRAIDTDRERWLAVWHGNARLLERAIDLCCEQTLARWGTEGMTDADEGELFLRFITHGASGVVGSWLDGGCRMTPEQLSDLIERFVAVGRQAIAK